MPDHDPSMQSEILAALQAANDPRLADLADIVMTPAYHAFMECGDAEAPMNPTYLHIQQAVFLLKMQHVIHGDTQPILHHKIRSEIYDPFKVGMDTVHNYHYTVNWLNDSMGEDRRAFPKKILRPSPENGRAISFLFGHFIESCKAGLIQPDGNMDNYVIAARAVRVGASLLLLSQSPDKLTKEYFGGAFTDVNDALRTQIPVDDDLLPIMDTFYKELAEHNSSGKRLAKLSQRAGDQKLALWNRVAERFLLENAYGNLANVEDYETMQIGYKRILLEMAKADVSLLADRYQQLIRQITDKGHEPGEVQAAVQEAALLDWEVLPPGELSNIARDIVSRKAGRSNSQPRIELERLRTLEMIREQWGADRCFYARGSLGKRRVIRDQDKEQPDEYIILVLQELDNSGAIAAEHAVAESPIAGPNALYVFRQDVSEGLAWREVMALPKSYAQDLGARPVRHTLSSGQDPAMLPELMTNKVSMLMAADKAEFGQLEFKGRRGIYLPRQVLG